MKVCTFSQLGEYGRLGNQLFQVASTIGIAVKNNMVPRFFNWQHNINFPNMSLLAGYNLDYFKPTLKPYQEPLFNFEMPGLHTYDYDLAGYFQSEKYWLHCKQNILWYLGFSEYLLVYPFKDHPCHHPLAVSIHVRRGDYLKYPDHHPILKMEYYRLAMDRFTPDHTFYVFTDDPEWCGHNFKNPGKKIEIASTNTDISHLYLMSLCRSHIIANSSFSWWGQYLAQSKKVIAPAKNKWFGPALPDHNLDDLYQDHWELI